MFLTEACTFIFVTLTYSSLYRSWVVGRVIDILRRYIYMNDGRDFLTIEYRMHAQVHPMLLRLRREGRGTLGAKGFTSVRGIPYMLYMDPLCIILICMISRATLSPYFAYSLHGLYRLHNLYNLCDIEM